MFRPSRRFEAVPLVLSMFSSLLAPGWVVFLWYGAVKPGVHGPSFGSPLFSSLFPLFVLSFFDWHRGEADSGVRKLFFFLVGEYSFPFFFARIPPRIRFPHYKGWLIFASLSSSPKPRLPSSHGVDLRPNDSVLVIGLLALLSLPFLSEQLPAALPPPSGA